MAIPVVVVYLRLLDKDINSTEYISIRSGTVFIPPNDPGVAPPNPSSIPRTTADEKVVYIFQV